MILNGGWWLVVWFPWVSSNEVNGFKGLAVFYAIAFIFTLLIEGTVNCLMLKKDYSKPQIIKTTIIVNTISYTLGTLAMYSYSF